jgi:hypothetical protein
MISLENSKGRNPSEKRETTEMEFERIGWYGVGWIYVALDRNQ